MNYYRRHLGDYARKAGHLTMLEHGAFNLLLDAYYDREQAPTKPEAYRIGRARLPEERAAVDTVLAEFFTEVDGRYVQARCEEEIALTARLAAVNKANGKRGGRPRKPIRNPNKTENKPNGSISESETKGNPVVQYSNTSPTDVGEKRARKPKSVLTTIPDDFEVSAAVAAWGVRKGFNPADYLEPFRDQCIAKDYRYDGPNGWDAAFRKCIREDWPKLRAAPTGIARAGPQANDRSAVLADLWGTKNGNGLADVRDSSRALQAVRPAVGKLAGDR